MENIDRDIAEIDKSYEEIIGFVEKLSKMKSKKKNKLIDLKKEMNEIFVSNTKANQLLLIVYREKTILQILKRSFYSKK